MGAQEARQQAYRNQQENSATPAFVAYERFAEKKNGRKWSTMVVGPEELAKIFQNKVYLIFTGGACNIIDPEGNLIRNVGRDWINDQLSQRGYAIFDPQQHEDTGGRGYIWEIDGPLEKQAIEYSINDLIELRKDTVGAVSCMEVLRDTKNGHGNERPTKRVIYIDGYDQEEKIFTFEPQGISTEKARRKHHLEYKKSANSMRKEFIAMMKTDHHLISPENPDGTLRIIIEQKPDSYDSVDQYVKEQLEMSKADGMTIITISNKKAHYDLILKAFRLIAQGKKVAVHFTGGTFDANANPTVVFPDYPERTTKKKNKIEDYPKAIKRLSTYIQEVNKMRALLVKYMDEDVDTDIVSTPQEALDALLKNSKEHESLNQLTTEASPSKSSQRLNV